jgi:hypothetical protein
VGAWSTVAWDGRSLGAFLPSWERASAVGRYWPLAPGPWPLLCALSHCAAEW